MIRGREFHTIIDSIFNGDVKGIGESEQLQTSCPKCQQRDGLSTSDNKYNLEINTKKRVFRCWKCESPRFSGTLGRLIKIYGNSGDYELYNSYAGSIVDYSDDDDEKDYGFVELPSDFILFSNMDINNPLHLEAYNYMVLERQIEYSILIKYGIGFCIKGSHWGRIIIPSYDQYGELNYFIGRAYKGQKPDYMNPESDKDIIIFNEGLINWDSTIYIVEGTFEFLSFPVNTIPQLGKHLSSALFFKLKNKKPEIIIILDPDAYINSIEIYQSLSILYGEDKHKIKIVKLKGNYDLDEIRREFGKDSLIKKIRTARHLKTDDYFLGKKYF